MSGQVPMTIAEYRALLAQGAKPVARDAKAQAIAAREPDTRPEAVLLDYIRGLAKQQGWLGEHTWSKDEGLRCILVRERVLIVQVLRANQKLTMSQQTWLDALRRTGDVEVYVWTPQDRAAIADRLTRRQERTR